MISSRDQHQSPRSPILVFDLCHTSCVDSYLFINLLAKVISCSSLFSQSSTNIWIPRAHHAPTYQNHAPAPTSLAQKTHRSAFPTNVPVWLHTLSSFLVATYGTHSQPSLLPRRRPPHLHCHTVDTLFNFQRLNINWIYSATSSGTKRYKTHCS